MYKVVMIGEAAVPMESAASIDLSYKHIFGSDPLREITNADETDAVSIFQRMGFVMAMFAKLKSGRELRKLTENDFLDWLDQFDRADLVTSLPDIQDVYLSAREGESKAKKNTD